MNHPKPEEWVPYLYGGLKPDARRQLKSHLKLCPECRGQIERWQRTTRRLNAWKLPRVEAPLELFAPALKWAAAAVVVLSIGFGFGRYTGGASLAHRLRAQLEAEVRQAVRQEMAQMVHEEVSRSSAALLQAAADQTDKLLSAYNTVNETRRTEDLQRLYVALKRQLDTVAINTEQEFVQLAAYHPPPSTSSQ